MTTQPTNNAIPSESPRDLKFNAGKIDEFVTSAENLYTDRFGEEHYTIEGLRWLAQQAIAQYGYITVDSFQGGANITLPNQVLRDTTTGEYYRWDGVLPKNVPENSTPLNTGGIGVGAWLSVGDAVLRGNLSSPANGLGDALISVKQPFTGSTVRTQHDKNADIIGGGDFDMVGDGSTDNTAAVNAAISAVNSQGSILLPSNGSVEAKQYRITGIINNLGVRFKGMGALVLPDPNGGVKQVNFHQDEYYQSLGYEYFFPVYQKMVPGQGDANGQLKVFLFGDSTVAGLNGETAPFKLETYLSNQLAGLGIPNATVVNRGVSGSSVGDMNATPDVTQSADLFIIKYGINDGGNGRSDRLVYFATNLRNKLAGIRAAQYGNMSELTIVLVGPNSTNDSPNNRNAYWYEQLRNIYLQAARDYQCAYFDTYSMMPDSYGLAGNALDHPSILAPGVGIHPMDSMQTWIWGKFLDKYFNRSSIAPYVSNNFTNSGAISGAPTAATSPLSYRFGINIYRAKLADGFPFDGTAITIRHVDQPTLQFLYGYSSGFAKCVTRTANIANSTWNQFTGTLIGLTLAGGWGASITPGLRVSSDGLVTISATLTGGTTASGTAILTGIPTALRPTDNKILASANNDGSHLGIRVKTDGTVELATSASSSIQVNVSYYI
jgi:lysophospholipase L1-like esterase